MESSQLKRDISGTRDHSRGLRDQSRGHRDHSRGHRDQSRDIKDRSENRGRLGTDKRKLSIFWFQLLVYFMCGRQTIFLNGENGLTDNNLDFPLLILKLKPVYCKQ